MMMFVVTPPIMYIILHLPTLFEQYTHLWSLLLLCSLPALFVCFCSRYDGLWWTGAPLARRGGGGGSGVERRGDRLCRTLPERRG